MDKEQRALSELNKLVGKELSADEWKTYVQQKAESKKRKAAELTNAIIKDIEQNYQILGLDKDEAAKSVITQMQNEPMSMAPISKLLTVSSAATRLSLSKKEEEFQKEQQKRKEAEQKLVDFEKQLSEKDALLKRHQNVGSYYNNTSNPFKLSTPTTNSSTPSTPAPSPSSSDSSRQEREIGGRFYISTPSSLNNPNQPRREVAIRSPFSEDDELDAQKFRAMFDQNKKIKL